MSKASFENNLLIRKRWLRGEKEETFPRIFHLPESRKYPAMKRNNVRDCFIALSSEIHVYRQFHNRLKLTWEILNGTSTEKSKSFPDKRVVIMKPAAILFRSGWQGAKGSCVVRWIFNGGRSFCKRSTLVVIPLAVTQTHRACVCVRIHSV